MNCKGAFPFRIGCTSYVLPDDILPNVSFMADKIDDIELVLFESREWSNLPDKNTVSSMQLIANKHNVTYSVHFPIDCRAGAPDPVERQKFQNSVTDIIRLTETLPVSGYLLHLEGLDNENDAEMVRKWQKNTDEFCKKLTDGDVADPKLICIENLGYTPELHEQLIEKYRFSHCIDLGHLWLYHHDWVNYLHQVIDKTRIIHLHGVQNGKDHRSLNSHVQQEQLQELIPLIKNFSGVITIEVFCEEDTFTSLDHFEELWHQLLL